MPNSAYATAKFAVKGFTEALIEDLRTNAPQVRVALVMPGHVGTYVLSNTRRAHGTPEPKGMIAARIETRFREKAPLTAAAAATIILDGVQSGAWRILVGEDAKALDAGGLRLPGRREAGVLSRPWSPSTRHRPVSHPLGRKPAHLVKRLGGVQGERGIPHEGRQLAR
jgi:short chain dehydrogenase